MHIEKAKILSVGDVVHFPADRGNPAGYGRVEHVSGDVCESFAGTEYVWVTVRLPHGRSAHVWPSNRLA